MGAMWTVPNILTVGRLIAAPLVGVAFLYFTRPIADWFALVLFAAAAATDWIDGRLARAWGQESALGAMLDPIADKAMVVIALIVLVAFSTSAPFILLPAILIAFREVFVSGLREFLGKGAVAVKVTWLAKWKTTVQMAAIAVLFAEGIALHLLIGRTMGMDPVMAEQVFAGEAPDELGLLALDAAVDWTGWIGVWGLWIAAAMTLWTGAVYFVKAWPVLTEGTR